MKERSGKLDELQNSFGETIKLEGTKTPGIPGTTLNDTLKKNLMSSSKALNKPPLQKVLKSRGDKLHNGKNGSMRKKTSIHTEFSSTAIDFAATTNYTTHSGSLGSPLARRKTSSKRDGMGRSQSSN